jgi:hypothetical protein
MQKFFPFNENIIVGLIVSEIKGVYLGIAIKSTGNKMN